MKKTDLKYRWRDTVLSKHGPDSSTTRLVLTVLSLRMDADGGSCYPSTRLLATETGLSRRAVEKHLRRAESMGWIDRRQRGLEGQRWKRMEYRPRLPDDVENEIPHLDPKVENDVPHVDAEGGERDSPRQQKGGEPHDEKVGNEVPLSSSIESPATTSEEGGEGVSPPSTEGGRAVLRFCNRVGSDWKLKTTPDEWAADLDYRVDLVRETRKAGDYWEERLATNGEQLKSPTRALHNWFSNAESSAKDNGDAGGSYDRL